MGTSLPPEPMIPSSGKPLLEDHLTESHAETQPAGFVRAWAVYALVHAIATAVDWRWGLYVLEGVVLVPPAIWVLLRPRSMAAVLTLLGVWSLPIVLALPKVANHELLTLVMNLTMLGCLLFFRAPGASEDSLERGFERFAPLLRLEIIVVYGFAAFHKLNTDFLDPRYSAAVALYRDVVASYPVLSGELPGGMLIAGSLAAESLLAVGLCSRRPRPFVLGLGLVFHVLLSLHPNPYILSFSAMLFALYSLFLPGLRVPPRALLRLDASVWKSRPRRAGVIVAGGLLFTLAVLTPRPLGEDPAEYIRYLGRWVFLGVAFYYIAGWLSLEWRSTRTHGVSWKEVRKVPAVGWLMPVLLVFNGLCPYLGLKTGSAFAMYSNLHTEGGICNHLLMPCQGIRVARFQEELVDLLDSSQPDLRAMSASPRKWTYFEFRRTLAELAREEAPGSTFFVRYRHGGTERVLHYPEHVQDEGFTPPPWFEAKLLHFRPVPVDPRMRVEHWE